MEVRSLSSFPTSLSAADLSPSPSRKRRRKVRPPPSSSSFPPLSLLIPLPLSSRRILCGIQVPPSSTNDFGEYLAALKYPYVEETQNPAYADFLGEEDDEESESGAE